MASNKPQAQPMSRSSSSETDIFSISDTLLAQRYHFIREIGAGNWGCVWLCKPKSAEQQQIAALRGHNQAKRVAVKLVFREKKETTAQRVRSLWNEMKIVRSLKQDAHPSIIPFHSFIITPSFAIITMEYLPQLVPVEVPEIKAREWFRSLLSAVVFLHSRGIVHNDIKPANILLSTKGIPVLVDFGFAERYDPKSKRAFLSNLAYGTPEYLSPERARGHVHDTRKSDVWSLGITFFEILVGRTPFEYVEGEKFATPEDLEVYWARTVKGDWIGQWTMSKELECLIRKLITPGIEHRISAKEAMKDAYWRDAPILRATPSVEQTSTPKPSRDDAVPRSVSKKHVGLSRPALGNVSFVPAQALAEKAPVIAKKPAAKEACPNLYTPRRHQLPTIEASPLKPSSSQLKENSPHPTPSRKKNPLAPSAGGKAIPRRGLEPKPVQEKENRSNATRDPSSSKMTPDKSRQRRGAIAHVDSPRNSPSRKQRQKAEQSRQDQVEQAVARARPSDSSRDRLNAFQQLKALARERIVDTSDSSSDDESGNGDGSDDEDGNDDKSNAVNNNEEVNSRDRDVASLDNTDAGTSAHNNEPEVDETKNSGWIHLAEPTQEHHDTTHSHMSSLIKFAKVESNYSSTEDVGLKEVMKRAQIARERVHAGVNQSVDLHNEKTDGNPLHDTFPRYGYDTEKSLTRSLKASLDKTLRLCSSTTLNRVSKLGIDSYKQSQREVPQEQSESRWNRRGSIMDNSRAVSKAPSMADSPLCTREPPSAFEKHERMTNWIRNVEQVVKEAQENFASSSVTPIPPLPARPASKPPVRVRKVSYRTTRNIIPADQIFQSKPATNGPHGRPSEVSTAPSDPITADNSLISNESTVITVPETGEQSISSPDPTRNSVRDSLSLSPQKRRRATVSTPPRKVEIEEEPSPVGSSPKRREKAKSQMNLFSASRAISPLSELQKELEKDESPKPMQPLSAVLDKNLFIVRPGSTPPLQIAEPVPVPDISISLDLPRPASRSSVHLLSSVNAPVHSLNNKPSAVTSITLNTPTRLNPEVSYERLLMSTSGVKRVGRGYQSDFDYMSAPAMAAPMMKKSTKPVIHIKKQSKLWGHGGSRMPPPVSSEDVKYYTDEFGNIVPTYHAAHAQALHPTETSWSHKDDGHSAVRIVREALKAIVNVKTHSKKQSRHL